MKKTTIGKINMFLGDNMEFMKDIPDKHYDLAIVDPPYGINLAKSTGVLSRYNTQGADWDKAVPGKEYFDELFRVSKNQIIWGGTILTCHQHESSYFGGSIHKSRTSPRVSLLGRASPRKRGASIIRIRGF